MSRFVQAFTSPYNNLEVFEVFTSLLLKDKFSKRTIKGEEVYFKSGGLIHTPQFIKLKWMDDTFVVEAWTSCALLPNVYIGEMDLEGFYGISSKSFLRDFINYLYYYTKAEVVNLPNVQAGITTYKIF